MQVPGSICSAGPDHRPSAPEQAPSAVPCGADLAGQGPAAGVHGPSVAGVGGLPSSPCEALHRRRDQPPRLLPPSRLARLVDELVRVAEEALDRCALPAGAGANRLREQYDALCVQAPAARSADVPGAHVAVVAREWAVGAAAPAVAALGRAPAHASKTGVV